MNLNDSLVGMAERTENQFIYSKKSRANPTTEIEIERVNIRPRKLSFLELLNLGNTIGAKQNKDLLEHYKKQYYF